MPRTVEDVIADVQSKARGRTRYEGQEPYPDEMLCAEITRLRAEVAAKEAEIARLRVALSGIGHGTFDKWTKNRVDRALLGAGGGG